MKRIFSLLLVLFITLLNSLPIFASAYSNGLVKTTMGLVVDGNKMKFESHLYLKDNRLLVPVRAVSEKMGAQVIWHPQTAGVQLVKGDRNVLLRIGHRGLKINGSLASMDVAPMLINDTTYVPVRFVSEALDIGISWDGPNFTVKLDSASKNPDTTSKVELRDFSVVVDAGHGGVQEPGAVYGGVYEKTLNLDIAKRLKTLLEDEGIKVHMTREDDSFVNLYSRSDLANKENADLLVSVHNNAEGFLSVSGSMTLYYPGTDNSKGNLTASEFARIVQRELSTGLNTRDIGVFPRPNLAVLRTAKMPAVIAEIAFMSNKNELNRLIDANFRQKSAEALKRAVLAAIDQI